jgi:hypothetical protein
MKFDKKNNEILFESVFEIRDWQKDLIPASEEIYDAAKNICEVSSFGLWAQDKCYGAGYIVGNSHHLTGDGLFPLFIQSPDERLETGYYLVTKEDIYGE